MKIISICGSVREGSSNAALLESFRVVSGARAVVETLDILCELPHFDPNVNDDSLPAEVCVLRDMIDSADVVVFSTPEYIHSLPAILKNCLEWLVGDPRFQDKPVVILHANESSRFALISLREVLSTMSAKIIEEACITLTLSGSLRTSEAILSDAGFRGLLEQSFEAVVSYVNGAECGADSGPG